MGADGNTCFYCFRRKLPSIFRAYNGLRDISRGEFPSKVRRGIAENENRQAYSRAPYLFCLFKIGDGKPVGAGRLVKLREALCAMAVCVCFNYAADFCVWV